jgi:hypothetical protein
MPQILHTVLEPDQNLAATAEQYTYDLPVNPLSAVIVTLRALNNTATVANFKASAVDLMAKVTKCRTRYRGATIFDGDPLDLAQIFGAYSAWYPTQGQVNATDNDVRSISFPLLFGRRAYNPAECFPASSRGDLVLEIETAADPTGLDGFDMQIETVELLDATPERFLKVTTTQDTMESGDVNDISLPRGNKLLGILLRGATYPTAASNNASLAELSLEMDNVEVMYSKTFWRGVHAMWARRVRRDWMIEGHTHTINGNAAAPAAYAQATTIAISADAANAALTTGTAARSGITGIVSPQEIADLQQFGWMDFDPLEDLSMAINTRGTADINLHVKSDVADGSASRFLPIEMVEVAAAAA